MKSTAKHLDGKNLSPQKVSEAGGRFVAEKKAYCFPDGSCGRLLKFTERDRQPAEFRFVELKADR